MSDKVYIPGFMGVPEEAIELISDGAEWKVVKPMSDKVLAELARRRELAKAATPGPWSWSRENRYSARSLDGESGSVDVLDAEEGGMLNVTKRDRDWIADSGTHRAKELDLIERFYKQIKAYVEEWPQHATWDTDLLSDIELAILGEQNG